RISIENGLIEVHSAFEGTALCKANVTYRRKYNGAETTC
ncbi:unnamed protein product, partial [Adineta steineri]